MARGLSQFLEGPEIMPANPEIIFKNVYKTYISDFKRIKTKALQDLTFQVNKGEVFGIIGPNGAGKSTALKALMGFIKYDEGEISLAGFNPSDSDGHQALGYLPENPSLYDHLSVRDHLWFCGRISNLPKKEIGNRIDEILSLVDLSNSDKDRIRSYSKGMTQRAALAYALFHQPQILILDEPMSGLDPLGRKLVVDIIKEYNEKGHTILFCSHVLTDVERICDRIGIMNKGKLVSIISPGDLSKSERSAEINGVSPLESYFMDTIKHDIQ